MLAVEVEAEEVEDGVVAEEGELGLCFFGVSLSLLEVEALEGEPVVEIMSQVQDDPEVGVLVLGAGTGRKGPGRRCRPGHA